jgi:hypothetical protein
VARGACAVCLVVAGAVAFTLTTHVPLPGLERILSPRTGSEAVNTPRDGGTPGMSSLDAGVSLGTANGVAWTKQESAAPVAARARVAATSGGSEGSAQSSPTAPAPAATTPTAASNPHAEAKGASSSNPHATAKGANSSARKPQPTKSANPRAVAARTKSKPVGGPSSSPPRSKK